MFRDRVEAGKKLAEVVRGEFDAVLGIPRGGVVVAAPIAQKLGVPLGVKVAVKISVPWNEELAMGALSGETVLWNEVAESVGEEEKKVMLERAREKMERYRRVFGERIEGKNILLVDDGVATGATFLAAALDLKREGKRVWGAVPVLPREKIKTLEEVVEGLFYLEAPEYFGAVGEFYQDFRPVPTETVLRLLRELG